MKLMIFIGIAIFGTVGGAIGNLFDHQSAFNLLALSGWNILMTGVGSLFGIWAGYKAGQYLGL